MSLLYSFIGTGSKRLPPRWFSYLPAGSNRTVQGEIMYKSRFILFILGLFVFVTACRQDTVQNKIEGNEYRYKIDGELPSSPIAQEWIADAAEDLADKLNVSVDDVTYIAFDLPVWPDSSYGCPQVKIESEPGSREGYQIQLAVNGRHYFYHGGEDIQQFLCETE
jgi:hypothetical protein